MTKLAQLKQQARQSAELRGHTLRDFRRIGNEIAEASCLMCSKSVHVTVRPMANQISISGNAVALNCDSFARR